MSSTPKPLGPPVYSQLEHDPDMVELIVMFVEEMPTRAALIEAALNAKDWKTLAGEAHKLRGSAGGHGFGDLGITAGTVEDTVRQSAGREEAVLQSLQAQVNELVSLCRRAAIRTT